jgi:hypothetical protein
MRDYSLLIIRVGVNPAIEKAFTQRQGFSQRRSVNINKETHDA